MDESGRILALTGISTTIPFEDLPSKEIKCCLSVMRNTFWCSPPEQNSEEFWRYFLRFRHYKKPQVQATVTPVSDSDLIFAELTPIPEGIITTLQSPVPISSEGHSTNPSRRNSVSNLGIPQVNYFLPLLAYESANF